MGAHSRSKGKRGEREVVALAKAAGLEARRSWELAQHPDANERVKDIRIGPDFYQVQVEAQGFARIYAELEGVRGYFFRADRREWLVALRARDYLELLRRATCLTEPY